MTFGEKLKALRARLNLSQEALAELLHVSRQAVTKWENGSGMPDLSNLTALSDLFGVSVDTLVREELDLEEKKSSFGPWFGGLLGLFAGMVLWGVSGPREYGRLLLFALTGGVLGYLIHWGLFQLEKIRNKP